MPLIPSHRHTEADLEIWARWYAEDQVLARLARLTKREARAIEDLRTFATGGPCYVGVSWGKESTIVAHLVWRLEQQHGVRLPVIWVRSSLWSNPDCDTVRDLFLAKYPIDYDEITTYQEHWDDVWNDPGFALARELYGERHVSGIRADESWIRKVRMRGHGVSSANTSAPIGWWSIGDVYAYHAKHELPTHPAYACTMNGLVDREGIRVDCLYGVQGVQRGRHEWELFYYGPEMDAIHRIVEGTPHPWRRRSWSPEVIDEALRWRLDQQARAKRALEEQE